MLGCFLFLVFFYIVLPLIGIGISKIFHLLTKGEKNDKV